MPDESRLRSEMVRIGRLLAEHELVCAAEGNLSARLDADRFLATPAGMRKGEMTPADLVIVDGQGRKVSGARAPSSELLLHLEIYRRRGEAAAVVHAHPITATAFTLAGRSLDVPLTPEAVVVLDRIAVAPYGMPGGPELAGTLAGIIERADAVLLDHHGAVTWGFDLIDAYNRMEVLEKTARTAAAAIAVGGLMPLPEHEVRRLREYREKVYLPRLRAAGAAGY
jgi:L-fuculose-phosphate aldolase